MVDARLQDGSRVNAVIPPLAIKGCSLTIRRFHKKRLLAEDLCNLGSASQAMLSILELAVRHRLNIVVSGGTGSGKTTLLNLLSQWIPAHERIVTIEDAAELQLGHLNLVSLEVRQANAEGQGAVTIRDLLRNSLRMRPDRIVVGECRGGEALDMLQAMNTGHEGSLTTVHANSPRDAIARLEMLVLMAGFDLPLVAIREQISSAVDLIVQQQRCADGRRRLVSISEVTGVESGVVQTQEIFAWRPDQARFCSTGVVPHFFERLSSRGVTEHSSLYSLMVES
jgi:pilus assembly protein CpaF